MTTSSNTYALYQYTPSLVAAVIFVVLFFFTTALHLYQRIRNHAKYFNPFIVGGIFQIIGYAARAAAHSDQTSVILYSLQTLLILLAPTLYSASIYMVLGRIITYLDGEHLSYIPVRLMTKIFVCGDILSFILQGAGGGIMSNGSAKLLSIGTWVIVGGLCVQLVFFGAFLISSLIFHYKIRQAPTRKSQIAMAAGSKIWPRDWRGLLFACYTVSVLILIRSIYRLIEFAQGNNGYVISHEVFMYVFDTTMMFLVMLVMNIFHPSVVLRNGVSEDHESKLGQSEVEMEEQRN